MKRRHILTTFPALLAACLPAFAQEAQKLQEAKNEQSPQKENAAMKHPATVPQKATIFITGSTDGLGHAAAKMLLEQGHRVIVHARSGERFDALEDLSAMGAIKTVGDLAEIVDVQNLARQVNTIGTMDAIIHNAGVYRGDKVMLVNTDSNIQNMEPGEICTERISHIIRVFEWDKDPDELETVDLKLLANGFQVCVVNENLFRLHRSSTMLQ